MTKSERSLLIWIAKVVLALVRCKESEKETLATYTYGLESAMKSFIENQQKTDPNWKADDR